ncbi:uncharacterized protein LOC143253339 isoform X7 [Tachypleus tridentatus]|uniref:uncharacterized protein LOC143253339 isoform X7 n=1 Tax=Tachypleus tridentatus TaxID=6853 RepID=UPI003FD53407
MTGQYYWYMIKTRKPKDEKYPVRPWLLGLFVFVVCGSGQTCIQFCGFQSPVTAHTFVIDAFVVITVMSFI